jgi:hypothetical protein
MVNGEKSHAKDHPTIVGWISAIVVSISLTANVFLAVGLAGVTNDRVKIEENTKAIYGLEIEIKHLSNAVEDVSVRVKDISVKIDSTH